MFVSILYYTDIHTHTLHLKEKLLQIVTGLHDRAKNVKNNAIKIIIKHKHNLVKISTCILSRF